MKLLGKTTKSIDNNSSGQVMLYDGQPGSESPTGEQIVAFNRMFTIAEDKWVTISEINGHFYIVSAEC